MRCLSTGLREGSQDGEGLVPHSQEEKLADESKGEAAPGQVKVPGHSRADRVEPPEDKTPLCSGLVNFVMLNKEEMSQ